MYRKGQNLRCFINGGLVGAETNLTITRGVDTEDGQNKDLVGDSTAGTPSGQYPVPIWKNMTFQVEAQGTGAEDLFTRALALMNSTGGSVGFGATDGDYNRDGSATGTFQAICNDLAINGPNRQPVTCSAQFTVISATATGSGSTAPAVETTILRGEFLRLFLTGQTPKYIGLATNVSLHLSLSLEDATTKDDTSSSTPGFKKQEAVTVNYDITSDCLYTGGLGGLSEGTIYAWELAPASGANQQTKGTAIASGNAMLTSLIENAPVAQNITYSATFTGVGLLDQLTPAPSDNQSQET